MLFLSLTFINCKNTMKNESNNNFESDSISEDYIDLAAKTDKINFTHETDINRLKLMSGELNSFAFELYLKLIIENPNLVYSPYSLSTALAMTYVGSSGKTQKEMSKILHFNQDKEIFNKDYSGLSKNVTGDKYVKFYSANALWLDLPWKEKFSEKYLQLAKTYYDSEINGINLSNAEKAAKTINTWVEGKTNKKIKDLLKADDLRGARLVLTNALYYKAKWHSEFEKESTRDANFHLLDDTKIISKFMWDESYHKYYENKEVKLLELPYQGKNYSMVFVLPNNNKGLIQLEKSLSYKKIEEWMDKMKGNEVKVKIPKFRINQQIGLVETLEAMGMKEAFNQINADFSDMTKKKELLYISKIIQQVFIQVDEKGTEAAAATAVVMTEGMVEEEEKPKEFYADHPFIYFIKENNTNTILFLGRMSRPEY